MLGAAKSSYRQTIVRFNRSRHQESGGTPLNTLCDNAHREGLKVLDFITHKTKKTFEEHHFTSEGEPDTDCSVVKEIPEASYLEEKGLQTALTSVCSEMSKKGFSSDDIATVRKSTVGNEVYENPEGTVYVHIDDVGVKKQKEHRDKKPHVALPEEYQPEKTKTTRPSVQQTSSTDSKKHRVFWTFSAWRFANLYHEALPIGGSCQQAGQFTAELFLGLATSWLFQRLKSYRYFCCG